MGQLTADIPAAGGNARFNLADNNKGLPQNRVFFEYRRFNTAIESVGGGSGQPPFVRVASPMRLSNFNHPVRKRWRPNTFKV